MKIPSTVPDIYIYYEGDTIRGPHNDLVNMSASWSFDPTNSVHISFANNFHEQNDSLFLYVLFSRETLDLKQCGEQLDYRNTSS